MKSVIAQLLGPKTQIRAIVLMTIWCAVALAQSAPLAPIGTHYAGRASDTGFSSVSNLGGYSTGIAIDLPPARGGITIPLQLVHSGRRVGVAGIGWDVPLSFVSRDLSISHRRPSYQLGMPYAGRELITVSLAGETTVMMWSGRNDATGSPIWVARENALALELAAGPNNSWRLSDGNGQVFVFTQRVTAPYQELWLLTSIESPSNTVKLTYSVGSYQFPQIGCGQQSQPQCNVATTVDLAQVQYNSSPSSTTCWKNEVSLEYAAGQSDPLSLKLLDDLPVAHARLLKAVNVLGRDGCGTPAQRIRRYELEYDNDPDTNHPRLRSAWLRGREGTPEASQLLPVAKYEYEALKINGAVSYRSPVAVPIPQDAQDPINTSIASTDFDPNNHDASSWRNLVDMTGDGRPDLIFRKNGQLWISINRPSATNVATFDTPVQLSDSTLSARPLASSNDEVDYHDLNNWRYINDSWRRTIDVNGDGRMDVIDATIANDTWSVFINTPGNPVTWIRRDIDVSYIRQQLLLRGHMLTDDHIPLSRQSTGFDTTLNECWSWDASNHVWVSDSNLVEHCGISPTNQETIGGEKTFTDWDVLDINGDGYPDLVFAETPASHGSAPPAIEPTDPRYNTPAFQSIARRNFGQYSGGLMAMFNVAGVRIDSQAPFSSPTRIRAHESIDQQGGLGCTLTMWVDNQAGTQTQVCGLEDVNGDGLVDRIIDKEVSLGSGRSFGAAKLKLPFTITASNPKNSICTGQNPLDRYDIKRSGLRDVSGDGIPEFIDASGQISFGTGLGFRPATSTNLAWYVTSLTAQLCNGGGTSRTITGLYDLDGDGKPEIIAAGTTEWLVFQLDGEAPGAPATGLITAVENGYGARTTITYKSAKEDASTHHNVPFPELVVSSVKTTGSYGLGGTLSEVRYAFGDADLFFDPGLDVFTIRAYGRAVEVHGTGPEIGTGTFAVIRSTHKLDNYSAFVTDEARFARYQRVGRVKDSYVLGHGVPADPWALLSATPLSDSRLISGETALWASRYSPTTGSNGNAIDCIDILDPYNWALSFGLNIGHSPCLGRGLGYAQTSDSWTGTSSPLANANNIATRVEVQEVDPLGRTVRVKNSNDIARTDDDLCIETTYASPTTGVRILTAPKTTRVSDCGKAGGPYTLSFTSYEYDRLAVGWIGTGNLTGRVIERHATDNGQLLATIREFEASYDSVGNAEYVVIAREDGALRTVSVSYDAFALVPMSIRVEATGVDTIATNIERDVVTLNATSTIDANETIWLRELDGFGRTKITSVKPPGNSGPTGVTSVITYRGFAGETSGRSVTTTAFATPVDDPQTATGRTSTVLLDELGRTRRVVADLGESYNDDTLVMFRSYDDLGRLHFEADPYPGSEESSPHYGTTYHFASDGALYCSIRGTGVQPLRATSNLVEEVLPTCMTREYSAHTLKLRVTAPDASVPNTQQTGVVRTDTLTAIGRVLSRETQKAGARLELTNQDYDAIGQLIALRRFRDPVGETEQAEWTWRFDAFGQLLSATEPGVATRSYSHSNTHELKSVQWTDTTGGTPVAKELRNEYDALGRLVGTVELEDGVGIPETDYSWVYDEADPSSPLNTKFTRGRLTATKSSIGDVYVSYDAFGMAGDHAYRDHSTGDTYFESTVSQLDGQPTKATYQAPDGGASEGVQYSYDSAGRLLSVFDETTSAMLYQLITADPRGRVLKADYDEGRIKVASTYANTGRRLLISNEIGLTSGTGRATAYTRYDAVGRELERKEYKGSDLRKTFTSTYDALGRLGTQTMSVTNETLHLRSFDYDPLGNLKEVVSSDGEQAYMTHDSMDRDRLCRVSYTTSGTGPCNVVHDALGSVVEQPTRDGASRNIEYFPSGAVRHIKQGGINADFRYDGTGEISRLDVAGTEDSHNQHEYRFGPFVRRRIGNESQFTVAREIQGPSGLVASRRGPNGPLIFPFADSRGLRISAASAVDDFVQETDYLPFGEGYGAEGATPGEKEYTSNQWNGGTLLTALGVVNLGARLYDPLMGRFLSRDPLMIPRTASTTNPYAFAANDPINLSDPTGLDFGVCATSWGGPCTQQSPGVSSGYAQGLFGLVGLGWHLVSNLGGGGGPYSPQLVGFSGASFSPAVDAALHAFPAQHHTTLWDIGSWFVDAHWKYNPLSPAPLISLLQGDFTDAAVLSLRRLALGASVANPGIGIAIGAGLEGTATAIETGSVDQGFTAGFQFAVYSYLGNALTRTAGQWINSIGDDVANSIASGFRSYGDDVARASAPGRAPPSVSASGTAAAPAGPAVSTRGLGAIVHPPIDTNVALSAGQRWLGPNYREIGPGVFRSADGLRQFRMAPNDIAGHGGLPPHVHFETFNGAGGKTENNHVLLLP